MKRLCIVPCGSKKVWDQAPSIGATEARHAYIGTFHKACQQYALQFFSDWVILSAKYGFLFPFDMVGENYDVSFHSKSPDRISVEELKRQAVEKGLDDYHEIVVLGGKKYRKVVEQVFDNRKLVYPLSGCKGIGFMAQKLQRAVQEKKEILFTPSSKTALHRCGEVR